MLGLRIQIVKGSAILSHLEDIARLRIQVFREWPYLYDGSMEYEREYSRTYCRLRRA